MTADLYFGQLVRAGDEVAFLLKDSGAKAMIARPFSRPAIRSRAVRSASGCECRIDTIFIPA